MAFPAGWTRRWSITSDHTLVPSDQGASKILFTQANLPAAIFTAARSDGGDIRFSSDLAGATQLAVEVVFFDAVNSRCEIWIKGDLHSAVDDTFYIWAGCPSATMPAATDTYGRNAVWQDHICVHHFQETSGDYINSFGDATYDGTVANVTRGVDGIFGTGSFCASFPVADNAKVSLGGNAMPVSAERTLMAWIKLTGFGGNSLGRIFSQESAALAGSGLCCRPGGTGASRYYSQPTNAGGADNAFSTGEWVLLAATKSAAQPALVNLYVNGVLSGVADQSITIVSAVNSVIGGADAVNTRNFDGLIDELRVDDTAHGGNSQLTMFRIQSNPAALLPTIAELPLAIGEHSTFRGIGRGIGRGIM